MYTLAISGSRRRGIGYRPVESLIMYDLARIDGEFGLGGILLVHGEADGIDSLFDWAVKKYYPNWSIESEAANWDEYGNAAGMIRNRLLLDKYKPNHLLAYPDDESIGTWGMIKEATKRKISYTVRFYD